MYIAIVLVISKCTPTITLKALVIDSESVSSRTDYPLFDKETVFKMDKYVTFKLFWMTKYITMNRKHICGSRF